MLVIFKRAELDREAAKILFNSVANFARLAACLVHLGQHQVIHAAQPTSSCSTSFLLDVLKEAACSR